MVFRGKKRHFGLIIVSLSTSIKTLNECKSLTKTTNLRARRSNSGPIGALDHRECYDVVMEGRFHLAGDKRVSFACFFTSMGSTFPLYPLCVTCAHQAKQLGENGLMELWGSFFLYHMCLLELICLDKPCSHIT